MPEQNQNLSQPEEQTKTGRPAVLDEKKRRQVVAILANGSSRRVAALVVGCSHSTIGRTAQRDPEFAAELDAAEHKCEIEALRQIRAGCFQRQAKMVAHQAIGMNLPSRLLASFGESVEKVLAVRIIDKNVLPAVPAVHDVVDGARILHSHRARHVQESVDIPIPRQAPKRIPRPPRP